MKEINALSRYRRNVCAVAAGAIDEILFVIMFTVLVFMSVYAYIYICCIYIYV